MSMPILNDAAVQHLLVNKKVLDASIARLLRDFEEEHGVNVEAVQIQRARFIAPDKLNSSVLMVSTEIENPLSASELSMMRADQDAAEQA